MCSSLLLLHLCRSDVFITNVATNVFIQHLSYTMGKNWKYSTNYQYIFCETCDCKAIFFTLFYEFPQSKQIEQNSCHFFFDSRLVSRPNFFAQGTTNVCLKKNNPCQFDLYRFCPFCGGGYY